jgi:colicin import membrane protein
MRRRRKKETGLGSSLTFSLLLHAAFFAAIIFIDSFQMIRPNAAPVYYVDIVNLPVANPRAGSPTTRGDDGAAPAAAPAPAPEREKMSAPVTPPKKLSAPKTRAKKVSRTAPPETDREFQNRLARLEKTVEGRHTDSAIDALRKKIGKGGGRSGMPGGTGTEAGSDYGSYIQSRLRDAFARTITSSARNPVVVVRLTIDRNGRVIGYRIERSSGDAVFEASVKRAVELAAETFPPPPGRGEFRQGFIFKPQGVGKK